MSRSKLDSTHITQLTFDDEAEAVKVKLQDTQISMELDANDGDSVTSHPVKLIASAMGCDSSDDSTDIIPALDCSGISEVHVSIEGSGTIEILVSPLDSGSFFYTLGTKDAIHKVCARRIKVRSFEVIGNVHLVGRS